MKTVNIANMDTDHTKEIQSDEDLYYDLQKDHVEAMSIILNGMTRRQLNSSQIHKNLSNFFYYVERQTSYRETSVGSVGLHVMVAQPSSVFVYFRFLALFSDIQSCIF